MLKLSGGLPKFKLAKIVILGLALALLIVVFYLWRLGDLTPGLSPFESVARGSSLRIHQLYVDPVNAPQRAIQYAFQHFGHHGAFWMRLSSTVFGLAFIGCFYYLSRYWFGKIIGLLSCALFATTPWIWELSRTATPDVLLLAPLAIFAAYRWLCVAKNVSSWRWLLLLVVCLLSIYVPGMIWLLLASLVVQAKKIDTLLTKLPMATLVLSLLLSALILTPLVRAIVHDTSIIKALLLIPSHWAKPMEIAKSTVWAALSLVWRTRQHAPMLIGRLPLLSIPELILVIFGVFAFWDKAKHEAYWLLSIVLFSIVAAGINGNMVLLTIGMPALGLLAAAGLRYLYVQWREVFPRNPISKAFALSLMVIVVCFSLLYGVRYTLVAWPHTINTKTLYVIK